MAALGGCVLYFAYGSNLLRERILLRNPSAAFAAVARLQVRAAPLPSSPHTRACSGGKLRHGARAKRDV